MYEVMILLGDLGIIDGTRFIFETHAHVSSSQAMRAESRQELSELGGLVPVQPVRHHVSSHVDDSRTRL